MAQVLHKIDNLHAITQNRFLQVDSQAIFIEQAAGKMFLIISPTNFSLEK
jgi:hypothetical protein